MKYQNPQLQSMLAAEYVLGTLRGLARRRFERLLRSDQPLESEVAYWETRLGALGLRLAAVAPPDHVWPRIQSRLGHDKVVEFQPKQKTGLFDRVGFWQSMAAAASIAAIVMGMAMKTVLVQPVPTMTYVSLLQDTNSKAAWYVETQPKKAMLKVKAMGSYPMPKGKDMELWLVMKDKPKPVSLGMLPHSGTMEKKLSPDMMPMLEHGIAVAVSMEPAGGSPTGLPTGPVIFSAPLVVQS